MKFSAFVVIICIIWELVDSSKAPLRIVQHPVSQVVVYGSRVVFKCGYELDGVSGDEASVQVTWLFQHATRNTFHKFRSNDESANKNQFTIYSFAPDSHTGQYRCVVNLTTGGQSLSMLSQPANLSLASIDSFDAKYEQEHVKLDISEGNVAIISCRVPASNPPAVPLFFLNDNLLPASSVFTATDLSNRYKIFPSGNLQISNVKFADSGVYRCGAYNPVTRETRNSSRLTNVKVYQPVGSKLPEIVYVPSEANRVHAGFNITLECVANGAPVPLVSWEKFGGILPDGRSQQVFGNLILVNVQPEDKGTYVCRAENGPGQATFKTAMIDVYEAPRRLTDPIKTLLSVPAGQTAQIECPIRARPRADVQWFINGEPYSKLTDGGNYRIANQADKSTLIVENVPSDGYYQCQAQNEYGSVQADVYLTTAVKNSPSVDNQVPKRPMIIMGPQNTTIYEGQSVVLLCVTGETSSGSTQINWLQNDLIIEPTLMRRFEINQLLGNLRIVSVQKSDAGVYKCIASNEYGMSTAEAYVNVRTQSAGVEEPVSRKKLISPQQQPPVAVSSSRPFVQQIGTDKILLRWHLTDQRGLNLDMTNEAPTGHNIAYFKVDYRTNRVSQWLTIDEQIDPKKREYILTDLTQSEIYRFRITVFFLNGELHHSYQSARFKLDPSWSSPSSSTASSSSSSSPTLTPTVSQSTADEFKLSDVQMQITQIWAISSSSLGLKWDADVATQPPQPRNKSNALIVQKINGFYIYYRKLGTGPVDSTTPIPIFNYTRINVPVPLVDVAQVQLQHLIDTYIIANLEPATYYEIKMTCYNLAGDLCSFSNSIHGLTLESDPVGSTLRAVIVNNDQQSPVKSTKHEFLLMGLGIVLGAFTLLLILFVATCVVRQTQHKKLLAQLHNTSQKLTSSSCPTLIYEDSLRQMNQHRNQTQSSTATNHRVLNTNLFLHNSANDSNSTNSQSMSTTTSSMTTPQTNVADNLQQSSHVLLLNGNTVSTASLSNDSSTSPRAHPPPIPQVPPPPICTNTSSSTLNRININLNPLNGYLDAAANYVPRNIHPPDQSQENFYHTLTTLGTLPVEQPHPVDYAEYTNSTLNMRARILLKQQQQQQQQIINTLRNLNLKQKQHHQQQQQMMDSKTASLMKRNNSVTSSKRSKKSLKISNSSVNNNNDDPESSTQATTNYYLLPSQPTNLLNPMCNIYNEVDLLTLEAALSQNNIAILNPNTAGASLLLLKQQPKPISTFLAGQVPAESTIQQLIYGNNIFDYHQNHQHHQHHHQMHNHIQPESSAYESSDMDNNEKEPMLGSQHYASSGIVPSNNANCNGDSKPDKDDCPREENRQLL